MADCFSTLHFAQGVDKVFKTEAAASGKPKKLLAISIPGDTLIVERGYDLKNLEK